jgi:1,4-alpha-glucan branching enzyme
VDAAHALGIGVWLDTVVNHYDGSGKAPLMCFDGQCPSGSDGIYFFPPGMYATTPWGPRPDYTEPDVASMIEASVSWWLGENRGDGFRWDSVSNIRAVNGQGTVPGGKDLLVAANAATHLGGGSSVAEDLKGYGAITEAPAEGGFGFDAQWDGFGYTVDGVLVPASDAGRNMAAIQSALQGTSGGDPFARVIFTEDHDIVGNGGSRLPSAIDPANPVSFAARRRSMLGAVLVLSAPGVPMLFMGQESLALGTFTDPPAPLAASLPSAGPPVRAFYKDMIALRRNLGGLAGGLSDTGVTILQREDTNKVIAYRRMGDSGEDVIVVLNFSNKAYTTYDVGVPAPGPWRIRLDTDWLEYGADFGGGQMGSVMTTPVVKDNQPNTLPVKLGAYAAVVFSR